MISSRTSLGAAVLSILIPLVLPDELRAEQLPDRRPAMVGSGPASLVNLIDTEALFRKGQRDAWVMFAIGVTDDGVILQTDYFTSSPNSDLLKNELRRRLRQTRFMPAVYNHHRSRSWFEGTVLFAVANGRPHLRIYANQDLDEIRRGSDFVAPQYVYIQDRFIANLPDYPSRAKHDEIGAIVKLQHSVDATGKTTNVKVISETPPGYQLGEYLLKTVPLVDFLPGYRNGRPTVCTYTLTWWFGHAVGW